MDLSNLKLKIQKLPQNPGVYVFLSEAKSASGGRGLKKDIIYIGKATNLKSRVSSYFRDYRGSERPIEEMIHQVVDISIQETESVLEALILEANLIKKYQPKYNVLGKDDKSFSYFAITKEDFPRVMIVRETELDKISNLEFRISNQAQISNDLISKKLDNSKLKYSKLIQNSEFKINNSKIFGPYASKKQMEIALKIMRKIFPFHSNKNKTEKGCLDFQLGRCPGPYAGAISKQDYAKNIRGIKMILEGKKQSLMKALKKEMGAYAKKLEFEKANEAKLKIFALQHIQDVALINRDDKIQIQKYKSQINSKNKKPQTTSFRMEAYDISNISGQQAVGSMVVFEGGMPNKKEYRKFKIKTVEGSNDVGMMQEVLSRRFHNDWVQPDLIFLDGGQGHLNMAEKLLHDLGFTIPLVSIAKGPTRKKLELHFGKHKLEKDGEAVLQNNNLIKSIMDEAHRFAISYHRKLRKKSFI